MILQHALPSKVFPKSGDGGRESFDDQKKTAGNIPCASTYISSSPWFESDKIASPCISTQLNKYVSISDTLNQLYPYEVYTNCMYINSRTLLEQATDPIFSKKYMFLARYIPTLIEAGIYMKPLLTIVTRLPNHWWANSCPTTKATHCLAEDDDWLGSTSKAVSLYVTNPQFSMAPV